MTNFDRAKKCIDKCVTDWDKTTLSDIEKWSMEQYIIWGMVDMALYFLNFNDYNKLKQYIYDKYGYNLGGVQTKEGE